MFNRNIENSLSYTPSGGLKAGQIQPSLHVGILATPQSNQGLDDVNFQSSTCYFSVDTEIHFETTKECNWTYEPNTTTEDNVHLYLSEDYSTDAYFGQAPVRTSYTGPITSSKVPTVKEPGWEYL